MFHRLPSEILDRILVECDPIDVASFSQTNTFARDHVYGPDNQTHLWHLIFLRHFDPPICSYYPQPMMGRDGQIEGEEHVIKSDQVQASNFPPVVNWCETVQSRIKLRQTLSCPDDPELLRRLVNRYPNDRFLQLYHVIFEILNTSKRSSTRLVPSDSPSSGSLNLPFLQAILAHPPAQFRIIHCSGQNSETQPLFALRPTLDNPLVSAAAELHTKYGLTNFDQDRPRTRGIARESCYALANYHPDNFYGPFMPDRSCRVNWPHLEALSVVVGLNLRWDDPSKPGGRPETGDYDPANENSDLPSTTPESDDFVPETGPWSSGSPPKSEKTLFGIRWPILEGLSAARPHTQVMHPAYRHIAYEWPPPGPHVDRPLDLNHYDWAGVEGKWSRIVCFLDYRDLHAYNFYPTDPRPRLDDCVEAVRLMTLDLRVISIGDRPSFDPTHPRPLSLQGGPQNRPPIYFGGTSAAKSSVRVGHPTAQVRGCVSMTRDGQVRWSVVSTAADQDRWSSEGIQVGGVRSRWGVLGVWTDVDRTDVEGPAGPFYFFKHSY